MSLLSEFLAITSGWRSVPPQQRTFVRGVRQPWNRWSAWGGAASPASSGPTAARTARGARNISSTRAAIGSRNSCSAPFSKVLWNIAPNAWSAWPLTIPGCAKRAARFRRRSINAIRGRRRFISIWCWACASCRLPFWCHCIVTLQSAHGLCRFASRKSRTSSAPERRPVRQ